MQQNINDALGNKYQMFFHSAIPVTELLPVVTLSDCVKLCNHLLDLFGNDLSIWDPQHHDAISRIMYANWIFQRLPNEPIKKPILVHEQNGKLNVDCGDTRIMALSMLPTVSYLSTIITVKNEQAQKYSQWTRVTDNEHLFKLCGFDPKYSNLIFNLAMPDQDWCIDWLEIGDQSTSHHLHAIDDRLNMLKNWLKTQPNNFRFDQDWITQSIDWAKFASK